MTTSGTTTFNLYLNEYVEEAFERCGSELRTGYDLRTASRSLNLLTIEWANKGINLWTIEQGTIPLIQLAPEWEKTFATHQVDGPPGARDVALPPDVFARLANGLTERLNRAAEAGVQASLVTSAHRRRFLRTVAAARGLQTPVLAYEEIGLDARPAMLGTVPA